MMSNFYSLFFFFLMIRRPPRSTLFPTRRSSDLHLPDRGQLLGLDQLRAGLAQLLRHPGEGRSEEHTSELQSPCNLVCRLLLEKKKKNDQHTYHLYPLL